MGEYRDASEFVMISYPKKDKPKPEPPAEEGDVLPGFKMCARCKKYSDHKWPLQEIVLDCEAHGLIVPCASCIGELKELKMRREWPLGETQ